MHISPRHRNQRMATLATIFVMLWAVLADVLPALAQDGAAASQPRGVGIFILVMGVAALVVVFFIVMGRNNSEADHGDDHTSDDDRADNDNASGEGASDGDSGSGDSSD
jgi:bacteriorhodopsin